MSTLDLLSSHLPTYLHTTSTSFPLQPSRAEIIDRTTSKSPGHGMPIKCMKHNTAENAPIYTAAVTLIRLGKSHVLHRFIGRQSESQEVVLVDLTSVSRREVSLQLRQGRLEQTVDADERDTAIVGVEGRVMVSERTTSGGGTN